MSQPPPGPPYLPGPGPAKRHWANSFLLGTLAGVVAIGAFALLNFGAGPILGYGDNPLAPILQGLLGLGFPLAYLAGAIVLTARPATMRFGAGLLIAIGVWLLISAGLCLALVAALSGSSS